MTQFLGSLLRTESSSYHSHRTELLRFSLREDVQKRVLTSEEQASIAIDAAHSIIRDQYAQELSL